MNTEGWAIRNVGNFSEYDSERKTHIPLDRIEISLSHPELGELRVKVKTEKLTDALKELVQLELA